MAGLAAQEGSIPMGLFDKVLGGGSDKLNEAEGFAGIALCAIAADGMITDEEAAGLSTTLARMKIFQAMSPKQQQQAFEKCLRLAKSKGVPELMSQAAQAVPGDLRSTAFTIAADLLMADGHVDPAEKQFLEKIQKSLGVADDLAVKIVEVISIKNKG